jgi:protoheme IX farnesyltransferase
LSAGGANAINMYVDRDIDVLMERTRNRPLVRGEVSPRGALVFAMMLQVVAFAVLWRFANLAAALLTLGAAAFYVFIYTLWLKRTSKQNIVIGGAAGAVPVLVGWVAVTGSLSWAAAALFVFMFLWTPPHFWALAIKHADEYRAAGVPMLPAVATLRQTTNQMVVYAVLLFVSSVVVLPLSDLGWIYGTTAVAFGVAFIGGCVQLRKEPSEARAMRLFSFSISYVTVLFASIVVDVLFS